MIKSDRWIRRMAAGKGMIKPFEDRQVRKGAISFGLSSYGYDIRIADEFKIFTNINTTIVDPKRFDPRSFVDYQGDVAVIPPNKTAARTDHADVVYLSEREKFDAVVQEIRDCHERGQPVLVGTTSVEKSERVSKLLKKLSER